MNNKLNGYAKWIIVAIAVAGIVWNAATLHNEVAHIVKNLENIEQRLEKIEQRQFERGKE